MVLSNEYYFLKKIFPWEVIVPLQSTDSVHDSIGNKKSFEMHSFDVLWYAKSNYT